MLESRWIIRIIRICAICFVSKLIYIIKHQKCIIYNTSHNRILQGKMYRFLLLGKAAFAAFAWNIVPLIDKDTFRVIT